MINGKSKRISVKTKISKRQKSIFSSSKLGTMHIVVKGHDLVAQIVYDAKEDAASSNDNVMGVDLGIKCPAVSYCPDGSIKFYGNGRKNKYIRRHYNNLRKRFQKDQPGAYARCLPTSMPQRPGRRGNFRTFVI